MDQNTIYSLIKSLFKDIDGYHISHQARKSLKYYFSSYNYAETSIKLFFKMMQIVEPKKNEIFYDLGCGLGKNLITAALGFPFSSCIGVEIIKELCEISNPILNKINTSYSTHIQIINSDFSNIDFVKADIVMLYLNQNATKYIINTSLKKKLNNLKIGARLITDGVPFISNKYKVFGYGMSSTLINRPLAAFHLKIA